jgi:hypothetical protein
VETVVLTSGDCCNKWVSGAGGVAQVVGHLPALPTKCEAPSSNPGTSKNKKNLFCDNKWMSKAHKTVLVQSKNCVRICYDNTSDDISSKWWGEKKKKEKCNYERIELRIL